MKVRTIIVDDEPLARERLRDLLEKQPEIELLAECSGGLEAVQSIETLKPDLVFLDVRMPELDGFGVVQRLVPETAPVIVFVTAYDQFALRAFEVHAVDYLLKPFDEERFQLALQRAIERIQSRRSGDLNSQISALLRELKPEPRGLERLAIKSDGRVLFLRPDEVDWIEAADNYVNLHSGKESFLHRETLSAMEAKLAANHFVRISRSTLVNVDRIKELQPLFHGDYVVILRNGTRLTLSRGFRDKLSQLLGKTD